MDNEAEPYVRVATRDELEELVYMNQRAFYRSPPQTFFSGVTTPLKTDKSDFKRQNKQRKFLRFLFRRSWSYGARVTVVVIPPATENEKERIAASAIWRPPITAEHKPPSMVAALRLGLIPVLAAWGYGALKRITELIHASESSLDKGFEARQLHGTPDDAWYLQLMCVDPDFQGKGFMSKLIREAFGHTPDAIFTLESTTPYSRGRYEHFGFQVVEEVIVGKGKADSGGVVASGEAATGFTIYPMIKS
ncbi:hypothetical protein BDZ89DRAFT_310482 [Hymenopellis radicata]|nr:hypothetical protein BDZ89DRAFT_310482 [Hymenopellis radicata]